MIIYKEDIEGTYNFSVESEFDFSKAKIEDALIEQIDSCNFRLNVNSINEDEFIFNLKINAMINYLDAKTLDPLKLDLDIDESVPFSFNKDTANELDIDFFDEEIDLKELVLELILVNIPFNYSENTNSNIISEAEFKEENNKPFAQIFNNNEKEK